MLRVFEGHYGFRIRIRSKHVNIKRVYRIKKKLLALCPMNKVHAENYPLEANCGRFSLLGLHIITCSLNTHTNTCFPQNLVGMIRVKMSQKFILGHFLICAPNSQQ